MTAKHGPGRRRPKHEEHEEHVNHERWLVSYSDMITVLMALFIVLYAMSQVDAEKFEALSKSLAEGFNNGSHSILEGHGGTQDGSAPQPSQEPDPASLLSPEMRAAQAEGSHLRQIQADLTTALASQGLNPMVSFQIDERGLVMGLVADDVFFDPARAELKPAAQQVVNAAAPVVASLSEQVSIEGHANVLPVSGRYATNWELSADRATQVLRQFVEHGGVNPARVRSVGYGDSRPLDPSNTEQALITNRRVDIVILSSAPENVRALLPTLTEG